MKPVECRLIQEHLLVLALMEDILEHLVENIEQQHNQHLKETQLTKLAVKN